MRPVLYTIFILLMLIGNCFAGYKLFTGRQEFLEKFPKLTEAAYSFFRFLPLINIISLTGLWFFNSWAAYLAIACGLVVIVFDICFGIWYHLYAAIPSMLLLLFFIIRYWNHFK